MSFAEDIFLESLQTVVSDDEEVFRNHRPDWLVNPLTGKNLELDFYLPRFKIAFEIQGEHHYTDRYQKEKDSTKRQILEKSGIILFEVSIFQISPSIVRRKIVARSFTVGRNFNLKPYNDEHAMQIRAKIDEYKKRIIEKYGKTDCCNPPGFNRAGKMIDLIRKYITTGDRFNFLQKGRILRCHVSGMSPKKIEVRSNSGRTIRVRYPAFLRILAECNQELQIVQTPVQGGSTVTAPGS